MLTSNLTTKLNKVSVQCGRGVRTETHRRRNDLGVWEQTLTLRAKELLTRVPKPLIGGGAGKEQPFQPAGLGQLGVHR